jgi:predicted ATPase
MKVRRLKIAEYKNIKDLELTFSSSLISLLIGKNGVGKSNLIEILALIFRGLDLCNSEEALLTWPRNGDHFEYEIDYNCKGREIRIISTVESFQASLLTTINDGEEVAEIPIDQFLAEKAERYLPDYIIGYYSGENKRIHEIIRPYAEIAWDNIRTAQGEQENFHRLFFVENEHAQLILLTLLLYRESPGLSDEFRDRVTRLLQSYTSFEEINELSILLKNPVWYKSTNNAFGIQARADPDLSGEDFAASMEDFDSNQEEEIVPEGVYYESNFGLGIDNLEEHLLSNSAPYPFWGMKGRSHQLLLSLYEHLERPLIYYAEEDELTGENTEFIDFDSMNIKNIEKQVFDLFDHPLNFFEALDTLLLVESLDKLTLTVKHRYAGDHFEFSQLSEGERQLFTVLGLLLITSQGDTLYLLDEPDTHLNPRWQRDYISLLKDFSLNQENSHIIVASHSPLLVQDAKDIDLFLFLREGNHTVVDADNYAIANWRIDHVLASKYFDLPSTRPKALDEYMELRKSILSQAVISPEDKKRLAEMADKYGTLPTGETIEEIEMQITLNRLTQNLKDDSDN